jgi:hypothetical protein
MLVEPCISLWVGDSGVLEMPSGSVVLMLAVLRPKLLVEPFISLGPGVTGVLEVLVVDVSPAGGGRNR